ncbi:MAG TPA: hypothetical protein VF520_15250 [Thermoleophilaceae bacterium]|jgi:hypothetical protein
MSNSTARHIVDEQLDHPASYLTVARGDRVYDLYGWSIGRVVEPRVTEDRLFDGLVVDFRGRRVFVDAPEVKAIYKQVVQLEVTGADLARVAADGHAPPRWPGGPPGCEPRSETDPAAHDDAVALMAALSRLYVADRLSLAGLEGELERVLGARTSGDLDAVAAELSAIAA